MLVSINMYVNAHCEATKKSPKGPFREASERVCVVKNLDLHLHVPTKVGDATLKSH